MSLNLGKVVLKSTTTMTLNDRFSDIMKMKSPKSSEIRAEQAQLTQASAKNKRLAEQMSRRSDLNAQNTQTVNVKNRLGAVSTKSRLGVIPRGENISGGRPGRGRLGGGRPFRGGIASCRGFSQRGRGGQSGASRGGFLQRRGGQRGFQRGNRARGRGQGGFRGRGRGGTGGSKPSKEDLDSELDSYMNVGKKGGHDLW